MVLKRFAGSFFIFPIYSHLGPGGNDGIVGVCDSSVLLRTLVLLGSRSNFLQRLPNDGDLFGCERQWSGHGFVFLKHKRLKAYFAIELIKLVKSLVKVKLTLTYFLNYLSFFFGVWSDHLVETDRGLA